jgi:hypothetical protein
MLTAMGLHNLSDAEIAEAQANLERCLEALDRDGEEGLQKALDHIYPPAAPTEQP